MLCPEVPQQLCPATPDRGRAGAVAVGSELAHPQVEGFWEEIGAFLTAPFSISIHLWSRKQGTQSQLVCVTELFLGPGSQLASKWRKEKIIFPL